MICQKIPLFDTAEAAYLETYISEYNTFSKDIQLPAMLVAPGGAYLGTSDREAERVALAFVEKGFQAFVLRYSCGKKARMPQPIIEGLKAIALIRSRAGEWHIDKNKIAVCGFSAGGHLCGCLATQWADKALAEKAGCRCEDCKPNAAVLSYPCLALPAEMETVRTKFPAVMLPVLKKQLGQPELEAEIFTENGVICYNLGRSMQKQLAGREDYTAEDLKPWSPADNVDANTAPCFVWITANDDIIPMADVARYVQVMMAAKRPVEYHMFEEGPHGLSLGIGLTADSPVMVNPQAAAWFGLAVTWLEKQFAAKPKKGK